MLSLRDRRFSPGRFLLNVDPLHTARTIFYPQYRQNIAQIACSTERTYPLAGPDPAGPGERALL